MATFNGQYIELFNCPGGDELPFDCSGQETFHSLLLKNISISWRRELVEEESAARSPLCAACPSVSQFINEAIHPHLVRAPNAPLSNLLPTLGTLTASREKKEKRHWIDFLHVARHAAEPRVQLVRGSQSSRRLFPTRTSEVSQLRSNVCLFVFAGLKLIGDDDNCLSHISSLVSVGCGFKPGVGIFLTIGPQSVLKFDRGTRAGTDSLTVFL